MDLILPTSVEEFLLDDITPLYKDKKTFLDIGAYEGWYSYLAIKEMPSGSSIYGFEPIDELYKKYSDAVESWKVNLPEAQDKQFILLPYIVSDVTGESINIYTPAGRSSTTNLDCIKN